jgi:hypothetical protein
LLLKSQMVSACFTGMGSLRCQHGLSLLVFLMRTVSAQGTDEFCCHPWTFFLLLFFFSYERIELQAE